MECTLYLTDNCNLRCKYCYEGSSKNKSYLSSDVLKATLDYLIKISGDNERINLVLLGGEPLLNKKILFALFDLMDKEYKNYRKRFRFETTTNGVLLDEKIMDIIETYNIDLSVSIDGDRYSHNINRVCIDGKDVFDIILGNVKRLIKRNINFRARMTVAQNNVNYLLSNIKYLMGFGIRKFEVAFNDFEEWDEEHLTDMGQQLFAVAQYYLSMIQIYDDFIIDLFDYKITTYLVKKEKVQYCCAGSTKHFVVNSEGDIYPCGYVVNSQEWKIGNVYSGLNKIKFVETARKSVYNNIACKTCALQFACIAARCGFLNYSLTGYLTKGSDTTCKLERVIDKYVKYVIEELYKMNSPRFMLLYNKVIEEKIELSNYTKEIIEKRENYDKSEY